MRDSPKKFALYCHSDRSALARSEESKNQTHFFLDSSPFSKAQNDEVEHTNQMSLDIYLHKNGWTQSRNQSIELIKNALVSVNGRIIIKPSFLVENPRIEILKKDIFVSRAGEKLDLFLKAQNIDLQGLNVLDIGSAKGGFAQVALKYGAKCVTCVDVGSNQLDSHLRLNPKIRFYENCAIADFKSGKTFDFIVCDVSFVSLTHILPDIKRLLGDRALLLFKPQFEVGKNVKRTKKGVVSDRIAIINTLESFIAILEANDFKILCVESCAIKGKEGNEETFIYIQKR